MKEFVFCEKCGKRLIEKRSDGLLYFKFGKSFSGTPVEILIQGPIRMKCLRRRCNYWNVIGDSNGIREQVAVSEGS